jgi:hypothetical protein
MAPATLYALERLPKEATSAWVQHVPLWKKAAARQHQPAVAGRVLCLIDAARLVADRLLCGDISGMQLMELARQELDVDSWVTIPGLVAALDRLRRRLKGTVMCDGVRIEALSDFRREVGRLPRRWPLVETEVLQRSVAWPALVIDTAQGTLDWTLPMEVRIDLANPGPPEFRNNARIDIGDWDASVRRARRAFVDAWLYKHSHFPDRLKANVEDAGAIVDFRIANEILKFFDGSTITLSDRSHEAYFGLLIGGPLFDPRAMELVAATGWRGDRLPNGYKQYAQAEAADYLLEPADDVDKKVRLFEKIGPIRFLTPAGSQLNSLGTPRLQIMGTAENMTDFVDQAFGQAWRKHIFRLAPDLAYAFKSRPGTESPLRKMVLDLLEKRRRPQPVLRLWSQIPAAAVSRALYKAASSNNARASFAMMRVLPGECGLRFWRVLWDAVRAPESEWEKFRLASSPWLAGKVLSRQLNRFVPTVANPHRSPEVLVIVGSRHLDAPKGWQDQRFSLKALLPSLQHHLRADPPTALTKSVGNTRIVLVPDDWIDPATEEEPWLRYAPELREALLRLSVFEYGFSRAAAEGMLRGVSTRPFESLFEDLLRRSHRGDPVIAQSLPESRQRIANQADKRSPPSGEYFMPIRVAAPAARRGQLELHAAYALTGLGASHEGWRPDFTAGLSPRRLHEAQMRLERAWALEGHTLDGLEIAIDRLDAVSPDWPWARQRPLRVRQPVRREIRKLIHTEMPQSEGLP